MSDNVTIIITSYNTPELLQNAYQSVRRFYPAIPVIIVDNSEQFTPCYRLARSLSSHYTRILSTRSNLGHGPAMKYGIAQVNTPHFLLMDSDVTINGAGIIERMVEQMHEFVYGIGQVVEVDGLGINVEKGLPYLHPHFALINKSMYLKYDPIINHGTPMLSAMKSIEEKGSAILINANWGNNITHHERGTRKLNPKGFQPKYWDRV